MKISKNYKVLLFFVGLIVFPFIHISYGQDDHSNEDLALNSKPIAKFSTEKDKVKLLFSGDTSLARGVTDVIRKHGKGHPLYLFGFIQDLFLEADFSFVNLECVLTLNQSQESKKRWRIRADPAYGYVLKRIGIDMVSVSNNHSLDMGKVGFEDTLETLEKDEIIAVGAQYHEEPHQDPVIIQVGQVKFGFLAYNQRGQDGTPDNFRPRPYVYRMNQIIPDIKAAKEKVDQVVVSLHWGSEYSHTQWSWQRPEAHQMIDAGADLIIGHHPHVAQQVEEYKGGLIAYSLGDFLFDKRAPFKTLRNRRRFMMEVNYEGKKRSGFKLIPINADDDFRSYVDKSIDVESWISKPSKTSYDFEKNLNKAKVERFFFDKKLNKQRAYPCSEWRKRGLNRTAKYQRWLEGRWKCSRDNNRSYLTVAKTGERSASIFREGVWAHPHQKGNLRMTWPQVPLQEKLEGFGGIPEWGLVLGQGQSPIKMRVKIQGQAWQNFEFAFEPGWKGISMDTSKFKGQKKDIVVEVLGREDRKEHGFMFNLQVME